MTIAGTAGAARTALRKRPFSRREWTLALGLTVVFLPGLIHLAGVWFRVDYQSHGFLVPIVAWWAALRERPRWQDLETRGSRAGALLMVLGVGAYLVGLGAGTPTLEGLGITTTVWGFLWYHRGLTWLRALAFPLAYLVFMIPAPPAWITPAIVRLQLLVSRLAVGLSEAFGIDIVREGNVLVLPSGDTLFVAEACSGVTSLITLLPIGVLLAYFTLRRWWTWTALIFAVVPIAMAGNLARVMVTIAAADAWGAQRATEGTLHEFAGLITYGVACSLLLLTGALLRRAESAPRWTSESA